GRPHRAQQVAGAAGAGGGRGGGTGTQRRQPQAGPAGAGRGAAGGSRGRRGGAMNARRLGLAGALLALAACGSDEQVVRPVEVVAAAPLELAVDAGGTLRAIKATPLIVPGERWSRRQLLWMLPEGSLVQAGELVARFSSEQSELELEKA